MSKELTLEENFERIEKLIEILSSEDVSLEQAFNAYSEGIQVLRQCDEQIDKVEKKVLKLNEEGKLEELV